MIDRLHEGIHKKLRLVYLIKGRSSAWILPYDTLEKLFYVLENNEI